MALNKLSLNVAIQAIQKTQPTSIDDASSKWATAIFVYSSSAMAGVTVPTLNVALLTKAFATSMKNQKWMDDLGKNLIEFWTSATWLGPGFTGVTIPPPSLNSTDLGKKIMNGEDPVTVLTDAIDKWTKTIKVTLTNVTSGATSPAPVI